MGTIISRMAGLFPAIFFWGIASVIEFAGKMAYGEKINTLILYTGSNTLKISGLVLSVLALLYPYMKGAYKKISKKWISAVFLLGLFGIIGIANFKARIDIIYKIVKSPGRGWIGHVHKRDERFGFAPIPESVGYHTFQDSSLLKMKYDSLGFRIPPDQKLPGTATSPSILFLGCSFTYGDATPAESTFAFLTAEQLGFRCYNAGVCGYGLLQMLRRAEDFIPKLQPDYVVIQYSSWLVARALSEYAPTYGTIAHVPVPFVCGIDSGKLKICPPVYVTNVFELPFDRFKEKTPSVGDYFDFVGSIGVPLVTHNTYGHYLTAVKRTLHLVPGYYTGNHAIVEETIYRKIAELCYKSNAQPVVLVISSGQETEKGFAIALRAGIKNVVSGDNALWQNLVSGTVEEYQRTYWHWGKVSGKVQVLDAHPNATAHSIIALALAEKIRLMSRQKKPIHVGGTNGN